MFFGNVGGYRLPPVLFRVVFFIYCTHCFYCTLWRSSLHLLHSFIVLSKFVLYIVRFI